ncbi:hypothetical protein Peur_065090 [Populus x canadensis]
MGAISCLLKFIVIYTLVYSHVLGMAFGAIPSNNGTGYKLKRLHINMALRRPSAPPPPRPAPRRGPVFASTAKTCYGRDLGVHFYTMELSRTVLHRIPDGGYNELRRRGTAPVTQISAPVANQRHGMGAPPKSPPGFMH